ncbi:MAG: hypothetical protein JNL79_19660 [Myxococcales bacterium]|nr:hypothetical protein [Myxococcales bacterium]
MGSSIALPAVDGLQERIAASIERHARGAAVSPQLVLGRAGAGRRVLLGKLSAAAPGELRVLEPEFPAVSLDTPAHLLLQIAALDASSAEAGVLTEPKERWAERISAARRILERVERGLVLLRVPPGGTAPGLEQRQLAREISDVVALLTAPPPGWMVVAAAPVGWQWPHAGPIEQHSLRVITNAVGFLSDGSIWNGLQPHAARLSQVLGEEADRCSPLQLRVAVALVAGGLDPQRVSAVLQAGQSLRALEGLLGELFQRRPRLLQALRRVACARIPVARAVLEDVAQAGPEAEILFHCFLYDAGGGALRFHDQLRWVVAAHPDLALQSAHRRLLDHYLSLDGERDPRKGLRNVLPWVEKFHHAALADVEGGVDTWLAMRPPSREQYWEYGWSLSYVHQKYAASARVFERVLTDLDPDDNYALHYFAFNLDRAGLRRVDAEESFRKAVEGDPSNAWWNARYVSFLTERAKLDAASRAFQAALENVDPDGELSGGSWLPYQLHLHVIRAALECSHLDLAERALDAVKAPASGDAKFKALRDQLLFLRETRRLREALFPPWVAPADWWQPRLLRGREGLTNVRFGRVVEVDDELVVLALAAKGSAVTYHDLTRGDWSALSRGVPPVAGAFVEVAGTPTGEVAALESIAARPESEAEVTRILRYLAGSPWRSS